MNIGDIISLIFTDYTIRTVALGAAILGIISGTLSSYTVLRKQSLLGDAMSHATLPGVVIAYIITGEKATLPLMLGAIIAGWLGALLVMVITTQTRVKQDSALGTVLAVFFGFGLTLLSWVQRQGSASQSGLDKFLFGRAAALTTDEVLLMAIVGIAALALVALFWKEFKLLSFDPDYAATQGFPVRFLDITLTTLIVVAIVVALQTVGVVLVSAMVVAPAAAARQWTNKLGVMVLISATFGAVSGVSGALISSADAGLPTGPLIVLSMSVIVVVSLLFAPNRGLVWDWVRRQQNRRELRTSLALEALYHMAQQHGDPLHPHSTASLQVAMPGRDARYNLRQLVNDNLVQQIGADSWALTPAGVQQVHELLNGADGTNPASQPNPKVVAI
ncbi:MAG: metal ABC transporter permease [Burkholderiales bacterium]|nr:metal ABC transporter permease [Anaerolineae bacterium]